MTSSSPVALNVVTEQADVRKAYRALKRQLERGAARMERRVGFQGGSAVENLLWHPTDGFWALLGEGCELGHYWCAYGVDPEPPSASLSIVCEINPPHEGFDRRCAGLFLHDHDGNFHLAHTGKVGGGRKGVGKKAFLGDYGGHLECLRWPDRRQGPIIVIGRIGTPVFRSQLGHFIREVRRFKAAAKQEQAKSAPAHDAQRLFFTPELGGRGASHYFPSRVEARCSHGLVVDALNTALNARGLKPLIPSDAHRDLFVATVRRAQYVLFAVKTDASVASLYEGIGQLMLHGATARNAPRRVLVLPSAPVSETRAALRRLPIDVLTYDWVDAKPVFAAEELLRKDHAQDPIPI